MKYFQSFFLLILYQSSFFHSLSFFLFLSFFLSLFVFPFYGIFIHVFFSSLSFFLFCLFFISQFNYFKINTCIQSIQSDFIIYFFASFLTPENVLASCPAPLASCLARGLGSGVMGNTMLLTIRISKKQHVSKSETTR